MIVKTYDAHTLLEKETITKNTSIIWNSKFYDVGSFELHTTSLNYKEGDLLAYQYGNEIKCGIIMSIKETLSDISITGYDLKGILNFRYVTSAINYTNINAETIIKNLATTFFNTGNRTINGIIIPENLQRGNLTSFSCENKLLATALKPFCTENEIGINVSFDLTNIIFNVVIGADRSDIVKFGRRFHNIEDIEHTIDSFNAYNVGYYKNENDEIVSKGDHIGINRRECFKEKDIDDYLKQHSKSETLRATTNERYVYNKDYFLGDKVSLIHNGLETVKQITAIKEVHEKNSHKVIPIFGTEKENPLKKLLRGE